MIRTPCFHRKANTDKALRVSTRSRKPPERAIRETYKVRWSTRGVNIRGLRILLVMLSFIALNQTAPRPDFNKTEERTQPETMAIAEKVDVIPQIEKATVTVETKAVKPKPITAERTVWPTNCEAYRRIAARYSWNVNSALDVMHKESGCNPYAVGDNYPINGLYAPSCGLFQVRTLRDRPSCEQLKNPETNIAWAYRLYQANGWQPWTVCNKGIARCY